MKGTPVSKGRVVAPARVITQLEDAHLIQKARHRADIWSVPDSIVEGIERRSEEGGN